MGRASGDLRIFVILNAVAATWMSFCLVLIGTWSIIHGERSPLVAAAGGLVATGLMTWGLWRLRQWALVVSRMAATAALGVSGWWLWAAYGASPGAELQPGLGAMLHPAIVIFWVWPIVWCIYSTRPHVRAQFRPQADKA